MTIPPHLHKDVHQEKEVKKESVTKKDGYKDQKETILVTGGAGYIGSHTVVQLLNLGKHLVIVDSLCNSSEESLRRVQSLAKANNYKGSFNFHKVDILDIDALEKVFDRYTFSACIHLAGLKAVGESSEAPLSYYHTNITGTLNLIQLLQKHQCRNFIFSSSATVYGLPTSSRPIQEDAPLGAMNPYGRTKQYIEEILRDTAASEPGQWNIILLRYFNPVGAHESGVIGEDPNGTPNNLMPYVAQVAIGRRPVINVFGDNYDTKDGTGVRDYIHIQDLARGHVAALEKIEAIEQSNKNLGCVPYNLGTGVGYSVMEMINSMSEVVGHQLPYKIVERRPGDVGTVIADPSLAAKELNWKAEKTLEDMCRDLWRWQTMNPTGYSESSSSLSSPTKEAGNILPAAAPLVLSSTPSTPPSSPPSRHPNISFPTLAVTSKKTSVEMDTDMSMNTDIDMDGRSIRSTPLTSFSLTNYPAPAPTAKKSHQKAF